MLFINQNGILKNVQVTYRKAKTNKQTKTKTHTQRNEKQRMNKKQKIKCQTSALTYQ